MSTIKVDTLQSTGGGAVTLTNQQAAKALLNFEGRTTNTTNFSFGISGVVDNGTGDYTVSFVSSFNAGTDLVAAGMAFETGSTGDNDKYVGIKRAINYSDSITSSSVRHQMGATEGDRLILNCYHGDLA